MEFPDVSRRPSFEPVVWLQSQTNTTQVKHFETKLILPTLWEMKWRKRKQSLSKTQKLPSASMSQTSSSSGAATAHMIKPLCLNDVCLIHIFLFFSVWFLMFPYHRGLNVVTAHLWCVCHVWKWATSCVLIWQKNGRQELASRQSLISSCFGFFWDSNTRTWKPERVWTKNTGTAGFDTSNSLSLVRNDTSHGYYSLMSQNRWKFEESGWSC